MEVLNLEGRIVMGADILCHAQNWLKVSKQGYDLIPKLRKRTKGLVVNTQIQLADAEAFVTRFTAGECTRSTPHIYISRLPFCPKSSSVYRNYWRRTRGL